jgi:hypothetical protein
LKERDHLVNPGVDGRINIKMDPQVVGCGVWTGSGCLGIGTGGGHF